jgi:hypothetical protein
MIETQGSSTIEDIRQQLVNDPLDVTSGPSVRVHMLETAACQRVFVTAAHAIIDGLGARALALGIVRHLQDRSAPSVDHTWRASHSLRVSPPPRETIDQDIAALRERVRPPAARLATSARGELGRSALVCRPIGPEGERRGPTSEVVLASFARAAASWNERHGIPRSPIVLMVPVNLRTPRSWLEGVCNATFSWPVVVHASEPGDVLDEVASQLRLVRTGRYSRPMRSLLSYLGQLGHVPNWIRRGFIGTMPVSVVPGPMASDGGSVTDEVVRLFGSAPADPTSGVSFGVVVGPHGIDIAARYLTSRLSWSDVDDILDLVQHEYTALGGLVQSDRVSRSASGGPRGTS